MPGTPLVVGRVLTGLMRPSSLWQSANGWGALQAAVHVVLLTGLTSFEKISEAAVCDVDLP